MSNEGKLSNGGRLNGFAPHISLASFIAIIGVIVSVLVFYFNDYSALSSQVQVNAANVVAQEKQNERMEKRLDAIDAKLDRVMGLLLKEK